MFDVYPILGYFSIALAISSYYILSKNIAKHNKQSQTLLTVVGKLKTDLEQLQQRVYQSSSESLLREQGLLRDTINVTNDKLSEVETTSSENSQEITLHAGSLVTCQRKIKSLEQGLSLVNNILESSASVEKPKSGLTWWQ